MGWWERGSQWLERNAFRLDIAQAAFFAVVAAFFALALQARSGVGAAVWAVLVVVPLAWRRRHPVRCVAVVYAVGLLHIFLGYPFIMPADVAVLVALYSVTVYGPRWAHRTAMLGAAVGSLVLAVALVVTGVAVDLVAAIAAAVFSSLVALVVWAAGLVRRARRETLLAWRDRAERLEVERDQQARIATAAERARIAREMHDIVAHSLSVVVAQADGGRYAAQSDPEAAGRALGTISETGRAALADMRRLLGVLREDGGPPGAAGSSASSPTSGPGSVPTSRPGSARSGSRSVQPGPAPSGASELLPQPGAQDIERLVETTRASGLRVSFVRTGTPRRLPPGAGLTAYRICQEALTNVLKHAGLDPSVTVLLQWSADALTVEVADDGRGAAATGDGAGHGLVGMRERAAMFGGTVTAGPRPGGGFRVRAQLPLPATA